MATVNVAMAPAGTKACLPTTIGERLTSAGCAVSSGIMEMRH